MYMLVEPSMTQESLNNVIMMQIYKELKDQPNLKDIAQNNVCNGK